VFRVDASPILSPIRFADVVKGEKLGRSPDALARTNQVSSLDRGSVALMT
jgi:hypothetical protein